MTIQVSIHSLSQVTFEKGGTSTWVTFENSTMSIAFFVPSYIAQEVEAVAKTILKDIEYENQNNQANSVNFHRPVKTLIDDFPTFATLKVFDKDKNSVVIYLKNKGDACALGKAFDL